MVFLVTALSILVQTGGGGVGPTESLAMTVQQVTQLAISVFMLPYLVAKEAICPPLIPSSFVFVVCI